jgi:antitoxin (DNA-binding transcriptional repressor) of toxin-antitoxin stability system
MTTVNTATLKQQLSHYLGIARQGKEVLITSHKRVIARLLAEDGGAGRLPLIPPTRPASELKDIGGFGLDADPVKQLMQERRAR